MKRVWLSWSSGKDSAWAAHVLQGLDEVVLCGLLTTINREFDRVAMHAVRRQLVERQAEALGLPLHVVEIPNPCPNDTYEARMAEAVAQAHRQGVTHIAFGDLFLEDVRAYRERMMRGTGIEPMFPLWGRPTELLARQMVTGGLRAIVTCVDSAKLPREMAGRQFDQTFLEELPEGTDSCAERGEFHTFAYDGPMFSAPIPVTAGDVVERDGFVFADLVPG